MGRGVEGRKGMRGQEKAYMPRYELATFLIF